MENDQNGGKYTPLIVFGVIIIIFALVLVWKSRSPATAPAPGPNTAPSKSVQTSEKVLIDDLIRVRISWDPVFTGYYGKPAPDFTAADINSTNIKLSSFKNKSPVMVVFWATWCPPCREEIPNLIRIRKDFSPAQLGIVAISSEDSAAVKEFAAKNLMTYTVISLAADRLPDPFNSVEFLPTIFFIDKSGIIRLACSGRMTENEIRLALKALESPSAAPAEPNSSVRL